MNKKYLGMVALIAGAAMALAACSSSGSSASAGSSSPASGSSPGSASSSGSSGSASLAASSSGSSGSASSASSGSSGSAASSSGSASGSAPSGSSSSASGSGGRIAGSSAFNDAALKELTSKIQGAIGSKDLSSVKIAMITNGTSSYWNEAKAGWNDAMKWLKGKGATGTFQEPTQATATKQVTLLETLSTQGYTGWGVSAVESKSLVGPIASAVGKGISVIAFDSPLPNTKAQFYIGTPNTVAGCHAGTAMKQAIGSGDVVAISGSLTAANTQERVAGFKKCMGSGIKIVQTLNDNQDVPTAVSDLQAAIQANPNIKGIYGVYSYDGGAAGQAVQAAGKAGKITIIADDGEAQTVKYVKSGLIAASMLQRPYYQGYMLAYCLAADKVLGEDATMNLVKPYFAKGLDNTLSTGVGVMTKSNVSDFVDFWHGIGIDSQ